MQPDNYPDHWNDYDGDVLYVGIEKFGFVVDNGAVNRFGARFRVAASYRGVVLEGYSSATAQGYSALCRVLFTWSAFESFLSICGLNQNTVGPALDAHGARDIIQKVRQIDTDNLFYQFIYARVNKKHRQELDNFFQDDPCNLGYLTSAIRHIFAHGELTPNADQVDPIAVASICNTLCDFLLQVMDQEFGNRVASGLKTYNR